MDGSRNQVLGTTYTNDNGQADFPGVPVGDYHVRVSGGGIDATDSETFQVDSRKVTQAEYVTVHQTADSGPAPVSSHSTMVSAADLNVPQKARKELDKANDAMAEQNWKKSLEHLNQAIAIAPQYATAYNNLGVLYAKTNDPAPRRGGAEESHQPGRSLRSPVGELREAVLAAEESSAGGNAAAEGRQRWSQTTSRA